MDWFTQDNRHTKNVALYQRKALHFLFSSEGRDELRCLNIPYSQLGFYSPMHFLSLITEEMCEPYRNDRLFLASSGTVRKGDKVLLLEKGTEGIIRSAIFKERRVRRNGETEILLDGHRRPYTEDEVVPYKTHLRQQLGTSLVPENNYAITEDGVLEWEEPTWEPGQEVYYKPEKRWATVLSHEERAKGKIVLLIKLDETQLKKEKTIAVSFNDLMTNSVPVSIPKLVQGDSAVVSFASSSEETSLKVNVDNMEMSDRVASPHAMGEQRYEQSVRAADEVDKRYANGHENEIRSANDAQRNETIYAEVLPRKEPKIHRQKEKGLFSFANSFLSRKKPSKSTVRPVSEYYPPQSPTQMNSPSHPNSSMYPESDALKSKSCNNLNAPDSDDDDMDPFETNNYTNSLRSSARKIIQKQLARESMRSASLKASSRSTTTLTRQHVAEIFTATNSNPTTSKIPQPMSIEDAIAAEVESMTKPVKPMRTKHLKKSTEQLHSPTSNMTVRQQVEMIDAVERAAAKKPPSTFYLLAAQETPRATSPSFTIGPYCSRSSPMPPSTLQTYSRSSPIPAATPYRSSPLPAVTPSRARSPSPLPTIAQQYSTPSPLLSTQPSTAQQIPHHRRFNPSPLPTLDYLRQKKNPLDYNFLPLSSSDLVKQQQQYVVNRVLNGPQNNMSSDYVVITPPSKFAKGAEISSDSSSHDNDSGRGSYDQGTPDINKSAVKGVEMVYDSSPKTRRHPAFERSPKIDESISYFENSGTINSNLQRRYIKNSALSKHSLAKYANNNEDYDNDEDYEHKMPHPFNPANLSHVAGYGKGIQGGINSSYADATLFALFACSSIFDKHLLFSKPGQVERGLKRDVRTILADKIVTPLRLNAYCKSDNVTHLREAMLPLSSKMHSPLIDAEEFLYLLFDSALNIESFIELSNGTKDYIHQIIARPKDRSKSQTVQFMLETSLGTSGHKFKQTPVPALFLCMPRCKGRLVYYEAIIPTLQLNITRLLQSGPKQCVCEMAATLECAMCRKKNGEIALDYCNTCKGIADQIHHRLDHSPVLVSKSQKDEILNLHSIICTRGNHHVVFVKVSEQRLSPWLFFDPMEGDFPEVTLLEDFGKWLDSLEKQPGAFREFAKLHPLLKRIMTDGQIYIYSKTHLGAKTFSESFAI